MAIEWNESAIVLAVRPHGEASLIATLLTQSHGTHAGLVQAARGGKRAGALQPGNRVMARWRARLSEHLGSFTLEAERSTAARLIDLPLPLMALQSACSLVAVAAPEREPHPGLFEATATLIDILCEPGWDAAYVAWEAGLLKLLGFGLDLTRCAATGANDRLSYVSPRTGRAVSESAAEPWRGRLLRLPGFLIGQGGGDAAEILDGLALTGHFLERVAFAATHSPLPASRARFVESYRRAAGESDIPLA
ncbi:MAG TPA: DNA repair protein RecO [Alphaproteobacteria bacterium]|nr:DNA repair protein RecO [Alphaproteobacteria bacterium]